MSSWQEHPRIVLLIENIIQNKLWNSFLANWLFCSCSCSCTSTHDHVKLVFSFILELKWKTIFFNSFRDGFYFFMQNKEWKWSGFSPINIHHLPCGFSYLSKTDYIPFESTNLLFSSWSHIWTIWSHILFSWHQNTKVHVKLSNFSERKVETKPHASLIVGSVTSYKSSRFER